MTSGLGHRPSARGGVGRAARAALRNVLPIVFATLLAALLATEALALAAWPFLPGRMLGTLLLLTLPFAVVAAGALVVVERPTTRRPPRTLTIATAGALAVALAVAAVAVYTASCLTVWGPLDVATYVIDAAGLAVGTFAAWALLRRPRWAAGLERRGMNDAHATAALACVLGALLLAGDAFVFPSGYFTLHEALWALGALSLVFGAHRLVGAMSRAGLRRMAGVAALGVVLFVVTTPTGAVPAQTRYLALSSLISHRAFVRSLWRLLDRDGDGFSPYFGGTDCDDGDARAYPLSLEGRDCTRLQPEPGQTQARPASTATREPSKAEGAGLSRESQGDGEGEGDGAWRRPRLILFVTIDAFRCGFGEGEAADLRDICPNLTRLGREGRLRTDVHTPATQTKWALGQLFGPHGDDPPALSLPGHMAALGFRTRAVPTCAYARAAAGVSEFEEVDTTLIATARNGAAISAAAINEHLLALGRTALAPGGRPLFVWTHEMDPHAPYLTTSATHWIWSPREHYAAEIRRTDAALGELVRALDASAERPGDVWVLISADHGEELGEHGLAFHGAQVFEESTRIPLVAWSSSADHAAHLPARLPAGLGDVGAYLAAALRGAPFAPAQLAVSWAPLTGDLAAVEGAHKVIFHPRLGLFEAFDLSRDPDERAPTVGSFAPTETPALPVWARALALSLIAPPRANARAQ